MFRVRYKYGDNMKILIAGLAVLIVSTSDAAERLDKFEPGMSRFSKCMLTIQGTTYISGPCVGRVESDGSFQINSAKYFALVQLEEKNKAVGYWNGEPGATHAHDDLGTLVKDGACWKNANVKVCAWK